MKLVQLEENLWLARYPLRLLGINFDRNVTIIRLASGKLVIHSTAPFTAEDLLAIRELGDPGWLLDATLYHDSYAREGCRAFSRIPYLAPRGFRQIAGVTTQPLEQPPLEWDGELEVLSLDEASKTHEHLIYHRASGTLIVCDLLFHFPANSRGWTRVFVRTVMRLPRLIGMSAFFRMSINDKQSFTRLMERVMQWDFNRLIVGHGDPIERDGKTVLLNALRERGFAVGNDGI